MALVVLAIDTHFVRRILATIFKFHASRRGIEDYSGDLLACPNGSGSAKRLLQERGTKHSEYSQSQLFDQNSATSVGVFDDRSNSRIDPRRKATLAKGSSIQYGLGCDRGGEHIPGLPIVLFFLRAPAIYRQ